MRSGLIVVSLAAAALTACAQESRQQPVSSSPVASPGAASQMPQAPNSLPLGSAVASPLDPAEGNIGTTRVGPSRPVARPAPRRTTP